MGIPAIATALFIIKAVAKVFNPTTYQDAKKWDAMLQLAPRAYQFLYSH
jgi:predicted P-loop ATPase